MSALITGIIILIIIYSIILFCLPFYVRRIRNEIIVLNENAVKMLNVLKEISDSEREKVSTIEPKK